MMSSSFTTHSTPTTLAALILALGLTACGGEGPASETAAGQGAEASGATGQTQAARSAGRIDVNVATFDELRADGTALVLDVRTPQEFAAGHVPDARNIDVMAAGFAEAVSKLGKEAKLLVYCRSGGRSVKAATTLGTLGFSQVHNLEGGYIAWSGAHAE